MKIIKSSLQPDSESFFFFSLVSSSAQKKSINFGWTLKICNPKYTDMISQAYKLRSQGTQFTNNRYFYLHFTFHGHLICLSFQPKQYPPVTFQTSLYKIVFFKHTSENLMKSRDSKRGLKKNIKYSLSNLSVKA